MIAKRYRNYLLAVLLVILAFNYVDRLALGLVLQDIKVDLSLSDSQLGVLSGIAFALFYSVMGIPIARWADSGNRAIIISVTTALWSVGVVMCGMAGTFLQLLLVRVGVAVGEAGCVPPAHSLIADYFTRAERPRATAIYMLGGSLSVVIGYFGAGWLNQFYGWRMTFILLGLPGFALAALALLTLKEPRQSETRRKLTGSSVVVPTLSEVFVTLWTNATFRHLLSSFSVIAFFGYGILQWQPAFLIRSYGLHTGELGTWLTLIQGLGALVGTFIGGELATRGAAKNERLQLKAMAMVYSIFAVVSASMYLTRSRYLTFGLMAIAAAGSASITGPLFATVQTLVPERMRAVSIALIFFFSNLIGMGLGPWVAGALSDALRPEFGEESLRYSLLCLCPGYLWVVWHLWRASKTVTSDLALVA
jgi:MFS family permease